MALQSNYQHWEHKRANTSEGYFGKLQVFSLDINSLDLDISVGQDFAWSNIQKIEKKAVDRTLKMMVHIVVLNNRVFDIRLDKL